MNSAKEIDIKNRSYYFFDDINIRCKKYMKDQYKKSKSK